VFASPNILALLTQPLTWVGVLVFVGFLLIPRRPVMARRVLLASVALVFLIGWVPVPDALLRSLEDRYNRPEGTLEPYVGIVVLGGALHASQSGRTTGTGPLSNVNERLTVPAALLRQYPHLRLLFAGGEELVTQPDGSKVSSAKLIFTKLGVDPQRVTYEELSRNTYENATLSAAVPGVDRRKPWLLVTSARHMPRSLTTFRTAGWNVTPYPVDYLSSEYETDWAEYSLAGGVLHWQVALREYVSGMAYFLTGRASPLR